MFQKLRILVIASILKASSLHHIDEYLLQHEFLNRAWKCGVGLQINDSRIFQEIDYHLFSKCLRERSRKH